MPQINWHELTEKEKERFSRQNVNIVYMSPDEYIERINLLNKLVPSRLRAYEERNREKGICYFPPFSRNSFKHIREAVINGDEMELPWIEYREGLAVEQEGYHRVLVCRDLNIKKIPVIIYGNHNVSWKLPPFYPEREMVF